MKRTVSPRVTPSMKSAIADLKLDKLYVIHAGEGVSSLAPRIEAIPPGKIETEIESL